MECLEYYTIKPADTLAKIAEELGTSVDRLTNINEDIDPENLIPGQIICVRSSLSVEGGCPFGSIPYTILPGDSFWSIAQRFNTTVDALKNANPNINPENLTPGQRICIWGEAASYPECESGNYYVIKQGDTLNAIAAAFEISPRDILTVNPNLAAENLTVGEIICLPVAPSPVEIVVNIGAKRLSVYKSGRIFRQYIVGTGKEETPTPVGIFTVINKQVNPGGPYGSRWLGLSIRGYGIHGTNDPSSIGQNASNGCIRMFNEDVQALFDIVPVGTVVRILP